MFQKTSSNTLRMHQTIFYLYLQTNEWIISNIKTVSHTEVRKKTADQLFSEEDEEEDVESDLLLRYFRRF